MGKATIQSSKGKGLYAATLDHGQDAYIAEKEDLEAKESDITVSIAEAKLAVDEGLAKLLSDQAKLDAAISDYASDESATNRSNVESCTAEVLAQRRLVGSYKQDVANLSISKSGIVTRLDKINSLYSGEPELVDIWCSDYNEGLEGDVGTIDIARAGEKGFTTIIKPAGTLGGDAGHILNQDGLLLPATMLTKESSFNSYAKQPGAAKWLPRYRKGTIKSKGTDNCIVTLDSVILTHQLLHVNQEEEITAEFSYMNCNGAVFDTGDRVVVAFTNKDFEKPLVIGFEKDPRPCTVPGFVINESGTKKHISYEKDSYRVRDYQAVYYDSLDWRGPGDMVVSIFADQRYFSTQLGYEVYFNMMKVLTVPHRVTGAAVKGDKALVMMASQTGYIIPEDNYSYDGTLGVETIHVADISDDGVWGPLREIFTVDSSKYFGYTEGLTPWIINESVTEATSVRMGGKEDVYGQYPFNPTSVTHKRLRLTIDMDTEAVTLVDSGNAMTVLPTADGTHSWTPAGVWPGTPDTSEIESTCTVIFTLEDYLGDTLITGTWSDIAYAREEYFNTGNSVGHPDLVGLHPEFEQVERPGNRTIKITVEDKILLEENLQDGSWTKKLVLDTSVAGSEWSSYEKVWSAGYTCKWLAVEHLDMRFNFVAYAIRHREMRQGARHYHKVKVYNQGSYWNFIIQDPPLEITETGGDYETWTSTHVRHGARSFDAVMPETHRIGTGDLHGLSSIALGLFRPAIPSGDPSPISQTQIYSVFVQRDKYKPRNYANYVSLNTANPVAVFRRPSSSDTMDSFNGHNMCSLPGTIRGAFYPGDVSRELISVPTDRSSDQSFSWYATAEWLSSYRYITDAELSDLIPDVPNYDIGVV